MHVWLGPVHDDVSPGTDILDEVRGRLEGERVGQVPKQTDELVVSRDVRHRDILLEPSLYHALERPLAAREVCGVALGVVSVRLPQPDEARPLEQLGGE